MKRLTTLSTLLAGSAFAGLTGQVSVTGQAVALEAGAPTGATQASAAALLQENLALQYSGSPFGPSIAILGAGLQATNTNAWGANGAQLSGRSASLDLSVGLLPRRAVPLRLYVRGSLSEGTPQTIPTLGGRESLAFGANLNIEKGSLLGWLPGVRADYEEEHFTGVAQKQPLGDTRRVASLGLADSFGEHQVFLGARLEEQARALTGSWLGLTLQGSWLSAVHQTTLLATNFDRHLVETPGLPAATTERLLRLDHVQRITPRLSVEGHGRLGQSRFDTGDGALAGLGLGVSWRPFEVEDLQVSAGGEVGLTQTALPSATAVNGQSYGGTARAGYSRTIGPVRGSVFAGAGTQWCGCTGLANGLLTSLDAGGSVGTVGLERVEARVEYRLAFVNAPAGRGGKRTEHHLLGYSRIRLWQLADLTLNAGYDDGFRDYIDVLSGGVASLHEQAFFAGAAVNFAIWRGTGTLDVRHARGSALIPSSSFVSGPPPTARAVTSASFLGLLPVSQALDLSAGAQLAFTALDANPLLSTIGASAGVNVRFGRIGLTLQYQLARSDTQGRVSTQHFLRLSLSRPFEVF